MPWPRLRPRRQHDPEALVAAAEAALDADRPEEALRAAREAGRALHGRDAEGEADALLLEADALEELGRHAEALRAAARACELVPDEPAAWHRRGLSAYMAGRFEDAEASCERAVDLDPDDADCWHTLGRSRVWLDDLRGADDALRRAARLAGDRYRRPLRIAAGEFDRIAAEVWRDIPAAFRRRLANTMLVVEPLPDPDAVEDGEDPDLLGVYVGGTALDEEGPPERIVLYQRNHETVCSTLGELHEEIRRTVLHEVGHHFGMDEHDLPY